MNLKSKRDRTVHVNTVHVFYIWISGIPLMKGLSLPPRLSQKTFELESCHPVTGSVALESEDFDYSSNIWEKVLCFLKHAIVDFLISHTASVDTFNCLVYSCQVH